MLKKPEVFFSNSQNCQVKKHTLNNKNQIFYKKKYPLNICLSFKIFFRLQKMMCQSVFLFCFPLIDFNNTSVRNICNFARMFDKVTEKSSWEGLKCTKCIFSQYTFFMYMYKTATILSKSVQKQFCLTINYY